MLSRRRLPSPALAAVLAAALIIVTLGAWQLGAGRGHLGTRLAAASVASQSVTVGPGTAGRAIPAGFLGLSIEYWALENYAGTDPHAVDPVLVQLIRNLVPSRAAVLRIGGVTTDRTWWPVRGVTRPPGVIYSLTKNRLAVANSLARSVGARLIPGIQFEANSRVDAAAEASAMLGTIGRSRIQAFELGNEPDLYASSPWYTRGGVPHPGRSSTWSFGAYLQEFRNIAAALGPVPVAGPAAGSAQWLDPLDQLLSAVPRLSVVTVHRYPLEGCTGTAAKPDYPTIPHLLAAASSEGLAQALAPYVATAHAHGVQIRNGEMNTVTCGSGAGVSNTFASSLWALDALFAMASVGLDGVNVHTYPGAPGQLFTLTHNRSGWRGSVEPEYYGLLMFAQAAPPGSRLLQVAGASNSGTLRVWATRAGDGRIRVVLINEDPSHAQTISVSISGESGNATVERLAASSIHATSGISLGGQSFGSRTTSGKLQGRLATSRLAPSAGAYTVGMPAASATMLTLG